ncbi:SDR family NAD(P)-dependent oxidoreductase [Ferrovibrio sp.]|uniref:SDR family NAD(P)-dependent oxidoreductase n=1 Tax=Ferrovibrio sp. TaxID=1917215 RepID=UPI003D0FE129
MFQGRLIWVIGATGAIGEAIAADLAAQGAHVVASGRDAAKLKSLGHEAELVNLADRASVDGAAARILARHGRIDALVNTVALPNFGDFLTLDDDEWLAVLQAKGLGYMRSIRAVLPGMLARGSGVIVNVSGRGGHQPNSASHMPGSSANAMVNLLTKGIANLYGSKGIRSNAVAPGPVKTPRYDAIAAANEKLGQKPPAVTPATTEQIAQITRFLLSDMASHLNGCILQADGGTTLTL